VGTVSQEANAVRCQPFGDREHVTVGVDALAAAEVPAGIGRVTRELLHALQGLVGEGSSVRFRLYARERYDGLPDHPQFEWRLLKGVRAGVRMRIGLLANSECDLFLSTGSYIPVIFTSVPSVLVVHDTVTFQYPRLAEPEALITERLFAPRALRNVTRVVCVSNATASSVQQLFPFAAGKTLVAHLGPLRPPSTPLTAEEQRRLPAPGFVLSVGTREPRKNLVRLLEAYAALDRSLVERHPLVVVGPPGWRQGRIEKALAGTGDRVIELGRVSDRMLAELYRRCAVFCYPSLAEGFGLPVLEAMSYGAAVLTSNTTALPEVGGDAVLYVDPYSTAQIKEQLGRLLADERLRVELGERARRRASLFSWERFASTVLKALGEALAGSPSSRR
jgi:glycosyltransferase involved in cell wall biosynthesis